MNCLYNHLKNPIFLFGKQIIQSGAILVCFVLLFILGCKKDLVNAESDKLNEFSLELPTKTTTIIKGVEGGDSVKAIVNIPSEASEKFDPLDFDFVWINLDTQDTLSNRHYMTFKDFEKQEPSLIPCLLSVTEKKTGKVKHANTSVFYTTATLEGWVLLGDQSGIAKLSVLTYTGNGYNKFIDINSELGIQFSIKGKPVSLNNVGTNIPPAYSSLGKSYQWMGVTTDEEIKFLRSMDFRVDKNISNYLTETLQPNESSPITLSYAGTTSFTATKSNNVYLFNTFYMSFAGMFRHDMLNTYPPTQPGAPVFRASSQHTFFDPIIGEEYRRLMYDEDNGEFVRANINGDGVNGKYPLDLPFSKLGFNLKAINTKLGKIGDHDLITAFLYNPVTEEGYMIEFLSNSIIKNVIKITSKDAKEIANSKFIEINTNANYLIYTKVNEVKAYDYKIGEAISLLNFQSETISLIKMQRYVPESLRTPGRLESYKELFKRLIVCTYNPANANNGGIFRQYYLPLGHQKPVKEFEETGFSKIVDVTFNMLP